MKKNLDIGGGHAGGVAWKTLSVLGVVAMVGLVFGVRAFDGNGRKVAMAERDAEVADQLEQIGRNYFLLHELVDERVDGVRQRVSMELAADISELQAGLGSASAGQRAFAGNICDRIAQDEKAHPEYYLTAAPHARLYEMRAWEAAGRGTFKAPPIALTILNAAAAHTEERALSGRPPNNN